MNRKSSLRLLSVAASVLLALALTASPLLADLGGPTPDSWGRLFRYAGCALGIAAATSGIGVAAAVALCLHVLVIDF